MTNEEKTENIISKYETKYNDTRDLLWTDIKDVTMEMAEWKEQQMIEKAQDFLANWFYEHPHTQMVCSDEFKNVDDLLEKFKDAMEE